MSDEIPDRARRLVGECISYLEACYRFPKKPERHRVEGLRAQFRELLKDGFDPIEIKENKFGESCPKCGSTEFAVARDMLATRHCNRCYHQWLPKAARNSEGV